MSTEVEVIKAKNVSLGQWIEHWKRRYEKKYDFSNINDKATFYEGMMEMAKHIAHGSNGASLSLVLNPEGVTTVYVNASPKLVTPSNS
jgi:hypothetical protein